MIRYLFLVILICVFVSNVYANEELRKETFGVEASDIIGRLDLDVPDSPGFAILGIAPQNVINPDTPAELASALILGDDGNGNGQEGLAIEFRPYLLARGDDITVGDYYHNQWLSRTALSLVESNGTDNSDETDRKAIGLSFTPIDERDPLATTRVDNCVFTDSQINEADKIKLQRQLPPELDRQLNQAVFDNDQARIKSLEQEANNYLLGQRKKLLEARLDSCLKKHQEDTLNSRQLQFGIAYHESEVDNIDESGSAIWISYAHPLAGGSLIAHARYSDDLIIPDADTQGQYSVKDETIIGLRFRRGDDRRAILFEASYVDESDEAGLLDDEFSTALLGAEFRLIDELWIQIAIGETFGSNQDRDLALSGQFRWSVSQSRLFRN